ncbi:hypothetical protein AMECASPLE_015968 [Ameca splendens]|uniref:Uncharacterized protein n=1 Tax=Ameca splendens TaxID=208324 RepID=A0ABV0ZXV0_9TELE
MFGFSSALQRSELQIRYVVYFTHHSYFNSTNKLLCFSRLLRCLFQQGRPVAQWRKACSPDNSRWTLPTCLNFAEDEALGETFCMIHQNSSREHQTSCCTHWHHLLKQFPLNAEAQQDTFFSTSTNKPAKR